MRVDKKVFEVAEILTEHFLGKPNPDKAREFAEDLQRLCEDTLVVEDDYDEEDEEEE